MDNKHKTSNKTKKQSFIIELRTQSLKIRTLTDLNKFEAPN